MHAPVLFRIHPYASLDNHAPALQSQKLREMARRKSLVEMRAVSVGSLVRAAVEKAYAGETAQNQPCCAKTPNREATESAG